MQNIESIIKKIQGLLALSNDKGAVPAEAAQAAIFAQRLIAKYDISDNDLYPQADCEIIESSSEPFFRKFQYTLGAIVADNYRCRVYYLKKGRKHCAVFMGRTLDSKAAVLVYEKLYYAVQDYANSQSLQYRGMGRGLYGDHFDAAASAFMDGIRMELEKQCHELMIVRPVEVDEKFQEKTAGWGHINAQMRQGYTDYSKGVSAGRDAIRKNRLNGQKALGN
jgi:hypothetical protein